MKITEMKKIVADAVFILEQAEKIKDMFREWDVSRETIDEDEFTDEYEELVAELLRPLESDCPECNSPELEELRNIHSKVEDSLTGDINIDEALGEEAINIFIKEVNIFYTQLVDKIEEMGSDIETLKHIVENTTITMITLSENISQLFNEWKTLNSDYNKNKSRIEEIEEEYVSLKDDLITEAASCSDYEISELDKMNEIISHVENEFTDEIKSMESSGIEILKTLIKDLDVFGDELILKLREMGDDTFVTYKEMKEKLEAQQ
jgi:hypothetical protein